jgi:integration host factor subunit beta
MERFRGSKMIKKRKQGIAEKAAKQAGVSIQEAIGVIQVFIDEINDAIQNDGCIELRGFGSFRVVQRKSRKGRNPVTGEKVYIAPCFRVKFKEGKGMLEALRRRQEFGIAVMSQIEDEDAGDGE